MPDVYGVNRYILYEYPCQFCRSVLSMKVDTSYFPRQRSDKAARREGWGINGKGWTCPTCRARREGKAIISPMRGA